MKIQPVKDAVTKAESTILHLQEGLSEVVSVPPSISIVAYLYVKVKVNKQVSKCDTK